MRYVDTYILMGLRLNNKYLDKIKRILRCAPTLRPQDFPILRGRAIIVLNVFMHNIFIGG